MWTRVGYHGVAATKMYKATITVEGETRSVEIPADSRSEAREVLRREFPQGTVLSLRAQHEDR